MCYLGLEGRNCLWRAPTVYQNQPSPAAGQLTKLARAHTPTPVTSGIPQGLEVGCRRPPHNAAVADSPGVASRPGVRGEPTKWAPAGVPSWN